jgi:hypothetical protein
MAKLGTPFTIARAEARKAAIWILGPDLEALGR